MRTKGMDDWPEVWKPEAGETLVGLLVDEKPEIDSYDKRLFRVSPVVVNGKLYGEMMIRESASLVSVKLHEDLGNVVVITCKSKREEDSARLFRVAFCDGPEDVDNVLTKAGLTPDDRAAFVQMMKEGADDLPF